MSQALFTSMTGLNTAQQQINVVSNNVANLNTTAFKAADARFSTLFSYTLTAGNAPSATAGGTNPKQIGLGTQLSAITRNFEIGSYLSTGHSTDQMISGQGYYTVMDPSGNIFLTRDGGFVLDAAGNLCTATGLKVLGSGKLKAEESSTTCIKVPQTFSANVLGDKNLESRKMSELNNGSIIAGRLDLKVTNSNNQTVNVSVDVTPAMLNGTVKSFFNTTADNSDLQHKIQDAVDAACNAAGITLIPTLTIDTSASNGTISWKVTDTGAGDPIMDIVDTSTTNIASSMGFYKVANSVPSVSNVISYTVEANPTTSPSNMTSLADWSTGADGTIIATYNNGDKLTVFLDDSQTFQFQYVTSTGVYINGSTEQPGGLPSAVKVNPLLCSEESLVMQIATVTNESGLVAQADNLWQAGPDSGKVTYTIAGQMGTGNIQTGGVESSNVDLARELSNMIIAQRSINANSRVFGTASNVLETLSQLGR